jgi:hypothetical protein
MFRKGVAHNPSTHRTLLYLSGNRGVEHICPSCEDGQRSALCSYTYCVALSVPVPARSWRSVDCTGQLRERKSARPRTCAAHVHARARRIQCPGAAFLAAMRACTSSRFVGAPSG